MNNKRLEKFIILSPYLLMLLVFLFNVSWNIADHDDGHTLGFHALGRDISVQRSYAPYDSMSDFLLGLLPVNYYLLLGFMVGVSFVSALSLIYFTEKIISKLFEINRVYIALGILVFLVGMPEFLYMLFSYKTVTISFNLILIGFYILINGRAKYSSVLWSSLLFGLGVSFRWNMIVYGLPIFATTLFMFYQQGQLKINFLKMVIWGFASLCFSFLFITLSGYPPQQLIKIYEWGRKYIQVTDYQIIARIGDLSLFLTPLSVLAMFLGLLMLLKDKRRRPLILVFTISSFISILTIGITYTLKYLAPFWPIFILACVFGIAYIASFDLKKKRIIVGLCLLAFFVNWFLGVQIDTKTSNWGPGLDIKNEVEDKSVFDSLRTDSRFKLENVKVGFYDGFSLPTPEGMRPLYGHFYALFMGKSKALDEKLNRETDKVVQKASASKGLIYIDRGNPYLLATYLRDGYKTNDPWKTKDEFIRRTFENGKNQFNVIRIKDPKNKLFDKDAIAKVLNERDTLYLAFTFTSALNKFIYISTTKYNKKCERLGPLTAKIYN